MINIISNMNAVKISSYPKPHFGLHRWIKSITFIIKNDSAVHYFILYLLLCIIVDEKS